MNQVTAKKKKMMRDIENIAKKLPNTKWTGDRVETAEGWSSTSISLGLSGDVPADQVSDLRVPGPRVGWD